MHIREALIKHLRSQPEQVVDGAMDHLLVARNWSCRENNGVSRCNANQAMILVCNARQGRGWLSLAARADYHHLIRMELVDVLSTNNHAFGDIQVAQFHCHLDV